MPDLNKAVCMLMPVDLAGNMPTGSLPDVTIPVVEGYADRMPPASCDFEPKRGVVAFRAFLLQHLGGADSGICRACEGGEAASDHHEGRAWDWTVNVNNPGDVERVQKLVDWLLKPGPSGEPHANFRRLGLRYLIWNRQVFSSINPSWQPYTGKSPHTDHLHMSFGWPGALARTSFFEWLGVLPDPRPIPGKMTPPPPPLPQDRERWRSPLALVGGVGLGYLAASFWRPERSRRRP